MRKTSLYIKLFSIAYLFSEVALAYQTHSACDKYFDPDTFWHGETVNVENRGSVPFILETTTQNAHFESKVDEYGSFECQVTIKKLSTQCLLVAVNWSPGADSSGCHVEIFKNGKSLGQSELYMSYK